ncbi:MAG: oligosaccharide flippase family protein, partial [Candidatus Zapsychrus exili]|nr:oligosaccharide flippase family protein [Candidatus Zapsychrus exili]
MSSRNIGKDSLKITMSRMIALVISMIAAMLLSRFRTLEEFGTYSQIYLLATLFSTIILLGVPNSISYFLARAETDDEKQKFLSLHFLLSTSLSLLTGLVLAATAPLAVRYFDNPMLKNFVFALMLFPWAKTMINSIDAIYVIYNKTSRLMIFKIVNSVLLLAIVIITTVFKLDFLTYMILFIGVQVSFAVLVYIIVARLSGRLYLCFDKKLTKKILKFSIPIGLSGVLTVLNIQMDKLLIGKFFSTEELAIYTNAAREMPLTIVGASITVVLLPQLIRLFKKNKKKQAINLWKDSIVISYIFVCFFAVV